MLRRAALVTSGIVGTAVAASYAPAIPMGFSNSNKQQQPGWGFVGYDQASDKAIVQFTNEGSARLVSIEEFEKMGGHPQLLAARTSIGRV